MRTRGAKNCRAPRSFTQIEPLIAADLRLPDVIFNSIAVTVRESLLPDDLALFVPFPGQQHHVPAGHGQGRKTASRRSGITIGGRRIPFLISSIIADASSPAGLSVVRILVAVELGDPAHQRPFRSLRQPKGDPPAGRPGEKQLQDLLNLSGGMGKIDNHGKPARVSISSKRRHLPESIQPCGNSFRSQTFFASYRRCREGIVDIELPRQLQYYPKSSGPPEQVKAVEPCFCSCNINCPHAGRCRPDPVGQPG